MPSSDKANRRRKEGGGEGKEEKSFRPKLSDFKRKTRQGGDKGSLPHSRGMDNMRRERLEEKSLQARRMDDIFEDFRNNIESILNPWSSSYLWHSPYKLEIGEEEEAAEVKDEGIRRTPLYDMVDKGDRYELEVELPGIEKDKIHVKATDDSIEISAEQLEEERVEERKKKYVYNERSYMSFYRTIP
ncbi:MAG TPA: Hsp20/alpha crystallin family protein, partial [Nitrososphaeraceae archaeon]|nr:Hsp20/alpha crystallin family protein [Nitrososphaeraceae archaeon]